MINSLKQNILILICVNPAQAESTKMLQHLIHWARVDDSALGQQKFSGVTPSNSLAVPMMLLFVISEVCQADDKNQQLREKYFPDKEWAVEQILQHSQVRGPIHKTTRTIHVIGCVYMIPNRSRSGMKGIDTEFT